MKHTICFILCLSLLLVPDAHARKKRKKGEPVISKRGKLIFEDDFSETELLWKFKPEKCQWKLTKGALATKSTGSGTKIVVRRRFAPVENVVVEVKMLIPFNSTANITYGFPPFARVRVGTGSPGTLYLSSYTEQTGYEDFATSPFPYRKGRWIHVLFEIVGSRYALTVNGKTVTYDAATPAEREITEVIINPREKTTQDLFAIDDVKVWEALPKDEEDEKGKKKRKRR